jgi:hypothetical protein
MTDSRIDPRSLSAEVAGAPLGDPRRNRRHEFIVESLASAPGQSLPDVFDDDSQLEGAYRLLNNKHVDYEALLAPHVERTCERAREAEVVYAIADTTDFSFSGPKRRIGVRQGKVQGFRGHFCLAAGLTTLKKARPLGLLGVLPIFRDEPGSAESPANVDPELESIRWKQLALKVEAMMKGQCQLIHLADREGDDYTLFATLWQQGARFIIRVRHDRVLETATPSEGTRLFEQLSKAPLFFEVEVPVSERQASALPENRKAFPARKARTAKLQVTAIRLTIRKPRSVTDENLPASLTLNYVHVFEPNPPEGEEPIDWKLVTTEPIDTKEEIEAVILGYRVRWVIEEYFKALKSGCGYEKNQLESRKAVLNYLALVAPVAWQLLLLRTMAQDEPKELARNALPALLLTVLIAVSRRKMAAEPTVQEALFAIAGLGGHIKNNGAPGWLVLGRGFQKLLLLADGWRARESRERCDQS